MILSRRPVSLAGLVLFVTLALGACRNAADSAGASPQDFLGELYGHYEGKGPGAGIDYSQEAELQRYFTPETMAAIEADFARADAAGEPPALNGDPFVGAQEWDVTQVDIAIGKSAEPDQAMAVVRILSLGETREYKLDLEQVDGAWKIADIDWGFDKLSAILVP
jgi:hypothetical protein